jgi:hypothetical protein
VRQFDQGFPDRLPHPRHGWMQPAPALRGTGGAIRGAG